MGKLKKCMLRAITICLSICMLICQWMKPLQVYAVSKKDDEFYLFLAEYLDNNYVFETENDIVENLEQEMSHHIMYAAMEQQGWLTDKALTLHSVATDLGYTLSDEIDLYEQILLELLVDYVQSDLFGEQTENDQYRVEYGLLKYIEAVDFVPKLNDIVDVVDDGKEIIEFLNELETSPWSWEETLIFPKDIHNDILEMISQEYAIPFKEEVYIDGAFDFVACIQEIICYQTLKEQVYSIRLMIEEIYRIADTDALRTASYRILKKLDGLSSIAMGETVRECMRTGLIDDLTSTTIKGLVMTVLHDLGFGIELGNLVSNAVFKTDVLAETQLLLEAGLEIESAVKQVIRRKQNVYENNVENANVLVHSVMFLYEAYEYGMELTKKYGNSVFDTMKTDIELSKANEYCVDLKLLKDVQYTQDEFNRLLKVWEGILVTNRTVFHSAWLEYKELHFLDSYIGLDQYKDKAYLQELAFDKSVVVLGYEKVKGTLQMVKGLKKTPENAQNVVLIYESSDPSILSFGNDLLNTFLVHKPGTVTVTVKTQGGLYKAEQQVIIKGETVEDAKPDQIVENEDFSAYYRQNKDGITVTGVIEDYVELLSKNGENIYWIPNEINGKLVTEVDFSSLKDLGVTKYIKREAPTDNYWDNFGGPTIKPGGYEIQYAIDKVVLPESVKRLANDCFWRKEVDVVLNEGLEFIGTCALGMTTKTMTELTLPSTIRAMDQGAFENCFGLTKVYINCPLLEQIPNECFKGSDIQMVIFSGEHEHLKRVGEAAFAGITCVGLPNSIEYVEKHAFEGSEVASFPMNLVEIGEEAYKDARIKHNYLPRTLKKIGKRAFARAAFEELYIPNSVEFIGESAFSVYDAWPIIRTYGECDESVNGTIERSVFQYYSYIELPDSVRTIDQMFTEYPIKESVRMVWTNGIDQIKSYGNSGSTSMTHVSLYLKDVDREGQYSMELQESLFLTGLYYDYIEIPYNYLDQAKGTPKRYWIKDAVVIGTQNQEKLNDYVEKLKSAIDVEGTISYKDENGKILLLYTHEPESFVKESKAKYENQSDYMISPLSLYENQIKDSVSILGITVSYPDTVKAVAGKITSLDLGYWEEMEDEHERARQLGDYMIFEDVYLQQISHCYFTIGHENEEFLRDTNVQDYIVSMDVDTLTTIDGDMGLYHIDDNGKITRIPISVEEKGSLYTISFQTKLLGKFAFVVLETMEETIPTSYREELHELYGRNEQEAEYDSRVLYENEEGTQMIKKADESDDTPVRVQKPTITEEEKNVITGHLGIKPEEPKNKEKWEEIEESIVEIITEKNNETLQIQLVAEPEKEPVIHVFHKSTGSVGEITKDVSSNVVKSETNDKMGEAGVELYEVELVEQGAYYFVVTEEEVHNMEVVSTEEVKNILTDEDIQTKEGCEFNELGTMILGVCGFLLSIGLIIMIVMKICFEKRRK